MLSIRIFIDLSLLLPARLGLQIYASVSFIVVSYIYRTNLTVYTLEGTPPYKCLFCYLFSCDCIIEIVLLLPCRSMAP
uniref:Uncharacterized protein n=1 Tax=Arundo donax TaxID=35708 RepID=A0A0A9AL90_ARUDO